ncbi:MBL fold metallo-hydrolase [Thorsellia anophelis]|uniref:L-ascorbate metabolism protein UlaG, beta-lactamase superfamily n=1 Tax=Thorsellia anophelis DSM 18579 TaxID=1123402 RepID=A0A1I0BY61_9GAMM|nr:MBL fold metallo-hydrolase [Thorsellia anophelis]SET12104.1 L-ascorbate metabolism protein UlaG, beta-lactamase superfamily [Thorsellia anophelis DSM 18579]
MKYNNPYFKENKPHHTKTGFINRGLSCTPAQLERAVCSGKEIVILDEHSNHSHADVQKWQANRKKNKLPLPPKKGYDNFISEWMQPVELNGHQDAVWWLGHASMMLRLDGQIILIDPVLTDRISPVSFWGPKRLTPAPISIDELPSVDLILISHNHYDHLDKKTITSIFKINPQVKIFAPLGLKSWFSQLGISNVIELDWWDDDSFEGIKITFTPAKHWSVRTLFDKNRSLWGGYTIKNSNVNFYFSGDSAYTESLHAIYDNLGPFDLICLPIGAYMPRWLMQLAHMDPQGAVKLYQYFGQPKVIPIHWGVFELGDESLDEPPIELSIALKDAGLAESNFFPFKIGQRIDLPLL